MASDGESDGTGACDERASGRPKLKRKAAEKLPCQSKKAKMIPTPGMHSMLLFSIVQGPTNTLGEDMCSLDEGSKGGYTENYGSDEAQSKASEVPEMLTPSTPTAGSTPKPKHASEAKKYPCTLPDCPKTFNRPAKLADHMRSHSGDRPFKCAYDGCDKSFMRRTSLKDHIQSLHTCVRNYACQFEGCDKRFRTSTKLKRHIAIHEGHERFRVESPPKPP
jgi:Zinc finger, C2H2 type